jgi:predicted RNA methylase
MKSNLLEEIALAGAGTGTFAVAAAGICKRVVVAVDVLEGRRASQGGGRPS